MYLPGKFEQTELQALHSLVTAYPLATVVALTANGLDANHIPLHLTATEGEYGTLRGHVARANPLWQEAGNEVLLIFQGPDAYITPSWYPTKQQTGKVVPTWNYAVMHARGTLQAVHDKAWIRHHLEALTASHEQGLATPWTVSEAPADYIEHMAEQVVGLEIRITCLEGKWKVSQNQPMANRAGVVQGLRARNGAGCPMARLVEEGGANAD